MYDVSVIILCYNRLEYTKNCFESLIRNCPGKTEVVFVDNKSTDGTRVWLKKIEKKFPSVKVVLNDSNLYPARGNAVGLRNASKAKAYLLCDNDGLFVSPDWYTEGMLLLNNIPKLGIINLRKSRWRMIDKNPVMLFKGIEYSITNRIASFSLMIPEVAEKLGKSLKGKWIGHVIATLAGRIGYKSGRHIKGHILDQSDNDFDNEEYKEQYEKLWTAKKRLPELKRRIKIIQDEKKN